MRSWISCILWTKRVFAKLWGFSRLWCALTKPRLHSVEASMSAGSWICLTPVNWKNNRKCHLFLLLNFFFHRTYEQTYYISLNIFVCFVLVKPKAPTVSVSGGRAIDQSPVTLVCNSQSVTASASATYKWFDNSGTEILQETKKTYTISTVTFSIHKFNFQCLVTLNSIESDKSVVFLLEGAILLSLSSGIFSFSSFLSFLSSVHNVILLKKKLYCKEVFKL